ncbi:MAG: hypothetical protein AB7O97_04985 [Planctomycetota bacterium]
MDGTSSPTRRDWVLWNTLHLAMAVPCVPVGAVLCGVAAWALFPFPTDPEAVVDVWVSQAVAAGAGALSWMGLSAVMLPSRSLGWGLGALLAGVGFGWPVLAFAARTAPWNGFAELLFAGWLGAAVLVWWFGPGVAERRRATFGVAAALATTVILFVAHWMASGGRCGTPTRLQQVAVRWQSLDASDAVAFWPAGGADPDWSPGASGTEVELDDGSDRVPVTLVRRATASDLEQLHTELRRRQLRSAAFGAERGALPALCARLPLRPPDVPMAWIGTRRR